MRVIGITGGVGAGKSRVIQVLQEKYGAVALKLDETAKELQRKGEVCYKEIVEFFGREILLEDEELDRRALAEVVFSDTKKLKRLNEIVHPRVKQWVVRDISLKEKEGLSLYVLEAALLPTAGYEDICEEMWYIYAEEAVRRARLISSRNYTEEKISRMMRAQPGEAVFKKTCTALIDNSGSWEDTLRQIGELV